MIPATILRVDVLVIGGGMSAAWAAIAAARQGASVIVIVTRACIYLYFCIIQVAAPNPISIWSMR